MYRMTIVAGPNRGATFPVADGETSIGRNAGNQVVLPSNQVSKRHCVLIASEGQLLVRDEGSSNGTFVNGVLVKTRALASGDRLGVGEFVFEVTDPQAAARAAQRARVPQNYQGQPANVLAFPAQRPVPLGGLALDAPGGAPGSGGDAFNGLGHAGEAAPSHEMPKDLKGKAFWYFENYVMPIFYGMNLKHEWRVIAALTFIGFLVLNIVISVQPLLDANYNIILSESGRRAAFMAKEIADRNATLMGNGMEGKTEIGAAESAENVSVALLLDLDQRVIAPANRAGQFMVKGEESRLTSSAIKAFRKGEEREIVKRADDGVVAIAPVKVYNQHTGKNTVVAVAVVGIDASVAAMSMGDVGVVYSEVFILTALVGAIMLFILYRLTLKPFQILNEDMDKALKGTLSQVTHEFKMQELNPLWDLINSALQRIPRSGDSGANSTDETPPEQFVSPLQMMADLTGVGLVICGADRRIVYANSAFEDISGIRVDAAVGQELSSVARDQSLGVLAADLFDRAVPGGDASSEDYDFSGVACTVRASAFGVPGDSTAKAYAFVVQRKAE